MRLTLIILSLVALCWGIPAGHHYNRTDGKAVVEAAQRKYELKMRSLIRPGAKCSPGKLSIRRAWDDLSRKERIHYLESVKCLMQKPTVSDLREVPGARNRMDDFTWAHIIQTNFIHLSGLLLPWHRQFMWAYERQLRDECGYTGSLPYWAWERHSKNMTQSPVFGSGKDSFGTNGLSIPHPDYKGTLVGSLQNISLPRPAGVGGGCIHDGPFANLTLHLGPVTSGNNSRDNIYGNHYNPRCLTRDFYGDSNRPELSYKTIADLYQTTSIHDFHPLLELGAHANSHGYVSGEESDPYSSPNDPIFFLIHGQIDRLWSVWQGQDYASRRDALDGTVTFGNIPPSENATLSTIMKMGAPAGGDIPISAAMSTIEGEYCYMYA